MLNDLQSVRVTFQGYSRKQTSRRPLLMLTVVSRLLHTTANSEVQVVMPAYRVLSCGTILTLQKFRRVTRNVMIVGIQQGRKGEGGGGGEPACVQGNGKRQTRGPRLTPGKTRKQKLKSPERAFVSCRSVEGAAQECGGRQWRGGREGGRGRGKGRTLVE